MPRMTYEEIKQTYPNEWVLLENFEKDQNFEIRSGFVIAHSTHRDEIDAARKTRKGAFAIRYTGKTVGRVFVL